MLSDIMPETHSRLERLKEIDAEFNDLMASRHLNNLYQLIGTVLIFTAQFTHLWLTDWDAGLWGWIYPILILVLGAVIIWRGFRIGKQVGKKIDEFFEVLRNDGSDAGKEQVLR